ncbi:hypothetical protein [Mesonia sp. K7]|uniref:hypothetical protein n=1 Tax=Mesonia sp. K7 TaxID=2218606 RepID=UPI000DA74D62|nr:hypothetical protein [Mesonia sp. K7]PZD79283.1 hypothetical protein DNG35_02020 [Mesonia sp. K7]
MKKLFLLALASTFTFFSYAQNTDTVKKTVTTKTKVKSNLGEEVDVKQQTQVEKEKLEVENSGETNQAVTRKKEMQITTSTNFYIDDEGYSIVPTEKGYVMTRLNVKNKEKAQYGIIRQIPNTNVYVLHTANYDSAGYFDEDGNFVVGTYDPKADDVILKKYMIRRNDGTTKTREVKVMKQ